MSAYMAMGHRSTVCWINSKPTIAIQGKNKLKNSRRECQSYRGFLSRAYEFNSEYKSAESDIGLCSIEKN
jgi:hypothetical protein